MIVYLIRHTKPNCPDGICYGQTDLDLSTDYEKDFLAIRKELDTVKFDGIYSSPLKRCSLLSEFIADGRVVQYDDRLKELNFGLWEMKSWEEIETTKEVKEWYKDYVHARVPEGESYIDLIDRVKSFVQDLDTTSNNTIAIVCHSAVIRAFHVVLEDVSPKETFNMKLGYGEVKLLTL